MSELVSVRCGAVLFDMDGTLVDSTQVVELAWRWWAVRNNVAFGDVLSFSHGRPTIATLEQLTGDTVDHDLALGDQVASWKKTLSNRRVAATK